jgi:hypothetical protein
MPENFRRRETLKTVLQRHRQSSRMLAESSQAEWRQVVDSGYGSDKYIQLAATTAELTRLLTPKIDDSELWQKPLSLIEVERLRSNVPDPDPEPKQTERQRQSAEDESRIIVKSDGNGDGDTDGEKRRSINDIDTRSRLSSTSKSSEKEVVTQTIGVSLQWLAASDGMYEDLEYDGDEPYSAPGMLTNVQPPQRVEKPLPPDAVRSCHHALTMLMSELSILDYGSSNETEHPDPV